MKNYKISCFKPLEFLGGLLYSFYFYTNRIIVNMLILVILNGPNSWSRGGYITGTAGLILLKFAEET